MFFHIILRSFTRERKRNRLAVLTVFLSAALITALMCVSVNIGDKMAREMKTYGANIELVPKSDSLSLEIGGVDYNPLKGKVYLEEADLARIMDIFWRNNIMGFAPYLKAHVKLEGSERTVAFIGTWFDHHLPLESEKDFHTGTKHINPYWKVEGEWPTEPSQVLAGQKTGLKVGQSIRFSNPEGARVFLATVVGVLTTGGSEDNSIVGDLALAQQLLDTPGKVGSVSVSALTVPEDALSRRAHRDPDSLDMTEYDVWYCTAYVSSITSQIEEELQDATAKPVWQVAASEGAVINKLQALLLVVTVAAMVASALGISSLMSSSIMERAQEIGLLKALGASNSLVFIQFIAESSLVGLISGFLGFAAGILLAQFVGYSLFGSAVGFSWITLPVVVCISMLVAIMGSILPCRLIARLHPAEVLHGRA
ncbi:MAG: ABC transporter permease [Deltaproteobacteria bacterium]|nr:MAG: ABC transporter permease [Deltaproteobacteria bacterium]PIE72924.1 MAG: ABC transporter permease [Deltaproteobacteria bacterium]